MSLTFQEITARAEALRQEIAHREELLAAYELILTAADKFAPAAPAEVAEAEPAFEAEPEPEPAAPPVLSPATAPAPAPAPPPVNVMALSKGYGGGIRAVTWAIRQMPGEFTVRDLAAALRPGGSPLRIEQISVILNRMKDERKLTEVVRGRGRTPTVFRATARVTTAPIHLAGRHRADRRPMLMYAFAGTRP